MARAHLPVWPDFQRFIQAEALRDSKLPRHKGAASCSIPF